MKRDVSFARTGTTAPVVWGGLLGLVYPAILIAVALGVGFRRGGDMADFAASVAGAILFLIAAPTAWVFWFSFIDVTRFTILVVGVLTSGPLWYLLGSGLARGSDDLGTLIRRYAVVCIAWTAFNILVLGVVAMLID